MYIFMIAQATYEKYRSLSVESFLLYYVGYRTITKMWWLWLIIVDTQRTKQYADVVELVDTLALGASASGREGSSPFIRTT